MGLTLGVGILIGVFSETLKTDNGSEVGLEEKFLIAYLVDDKVGQRYFARSNVVTQRRQVIMNLLNCKLRRFSGKDFGQYISTEIVSALAPTSDLKFCSLRGILRYV